MLHDVIEEFSPGSVPRCCANLCLATSEWGGINRKKHGRNHQTYIAGLLLSISTLTIGLPLGVNYLVYHMNKHT